MRLPPGLLQPSALPWKRSDSCHLRLPTPFDNAADRVYGFAYTRRG